MSFLGQNILTVIFSLLVYLSRFDKPLNTEDLKSLSQDFVSQEFGLVWEELFFD